MQEARSGQMKLGYFTERGRKSHSHDCQDKRSARVLGESSSGRADACALTAWRFSDAAELSVPVPQQQGGISGAWQDVAVSTNVWLGAGKAGHHVPMAKHNLS